VLANGESSRWQVASAKVTEDADTAAGVTVTFWVPPLRVTAVAPARFAPSIVTDAPGTARSRDSATIRGAGGPLVCRIWLAPQ
jgi:hypothetical protein